jgi:hypothetical protein
MSYSKRLHRTSAAVFARWSLSCWPDSPSSRRRDDRNDRAIADITEARRLGFPDNKDRDWRAMKRGVPGDSLHKGIEWRVRVGTP